MEEKSNQWEHLVWLGRHFTDNDNPYSRHEIKQRASTSRPYVLWSSVDDQPCHTRSGFFKTLDDAMMRANEIHREVYKDLNPVQSEGLPTDEWMRLYRGDGPMTASEVQLRRKVVKGEFPGLKRRVFTEEELEKGNSVPAVEVDCTDRDNIIMSYDEFHRIKAYARYLRKLIKKVEKQNG
jgi:uncharacterized short protein YbdD (DUF466 family)